MHDQFYIRFKNKPTHKYSAPTTFIEFNGVWISAYDNACLYGVSFISESSWERNWFERNPDIYKMIKNNDKVIAKNNINHKNSSIAFLAHEVSSGNSIIIADDKIFKNKDAPTNAKEVA